MFFFFTYTKKKKNFVSFFEAYHLRNFRINVCTQKGSIVYKRKYLYLLFTKVYNTNSLFWPFKIVRKLKIHLYSVFLFGNIRKVCYILRKLHKVLCILRLIKLIIFNFFCPILCEFKGKFMRGIIIKLLRKILEFLSSDIETDEIFR